MRPGRYLGASSPSRARPATAPRSSQTGMSMPLTGTCTIIDSRLSLALSRSASHTAASRGTDPNKFFFSSDAHVCAHVNVGSAVEFCALLRDKMADPRLAHLHLVYYCNPAEATRNLAAFYMAAYMVALPLSLSHTLPTRPRRRSQALTAPRGRWPRRLPARLTLYTTGH
jgi:hypothetical protein